MGRSNHKTSRRNLIKSAAGTSLGIGGLDLLSRSIFEGLIFGSETANAAVTNMRYVNIQMPGAPSRYMFDLFLTPYENNRYQQHPYIATRYSATGGRYVGLKYETIAHAGIQVPYMWKYAVPSSGGGNRPMTDLLENLLCIQGMTSGNSAHGGSRSMHFVPAGAGQSLGALVADASSVSIPAVNLIGTEDFKFRSATGKSVIKLVDRSNFLIELTRAFRLSLADQDLKNLQVSVRTAFNQAVEALDMMAKAEHPYSEAIKKNAQSAQGLIESGFGDLQAIWDDLLAKYRDLIKRALAPTQVFEGFNDLPIGKTSGRGKEYHCDGAVYNMDDLRDMVGTNSMIAGLAENFALTEHILTTDLSRSITMNAGHINTLDYRFDEHKEGAMVVLYGNFRMYRALSACLLELIDRLKEANVFNQTILDVGGEFNRVPRMDLSGSDHGWKGKSVALYSGSFDGPLIVGELKNDPAPVNLGTWGYGADVAAWGRQIGLNDYAATLAHLLGVPSPLASGKLIVSRQGNTLTPLAPKTKIVAG